MVQEVKMSLSVSVRSNFVWFGAFKAFESICFEGVARNLKGCFKEVLRVFAENFKDVSRKFQECFKEGSGKS